MEDIAITRPPWICSLQSLWSNPKYIIVHILKWHTLIKLLSRTQISSRDYVALHPRDKKGNMRWAWKICWLWICNTFVTIELLWMMISEPVKLFVTSVDKFPKLQIYWDTTPVYTDLGTKKQSLPLSIT